MNISVVIPAYNVEEFLQTAVCSAIDCPEVKEVIIVEDGSADSTLNLCLKLEKEHPEIKVYQHPGGKNKGASASRNLGIGMATEEFISFLDADDFYLPNRFAAERTIFHKNPTADGVYGAIGAHFITQKGKEQFGGSKMKELTTVSGSPPPDDLLYVLLGDNKNYRGHIHLNALTVRKAIFNKSGLFDEELEFAEDTDLIIRMAVTGRLFPGMTEQPVAMRGVHDRNRITRSTRKLYRSWAILYNKLYVWGGANGMPERARSLCLRKALVMRPYNENSFNGLKFLLKLRNSYPELRADNAAYREIVFGVFGDNLLGRIYIKFTNF